MPLSTRVMFFKLFLADHAVTVEIELEAQHHLAAVFEASQAGLLYLGDSADITEEVINALNAQ